MNILFSIIFKNLSGIESTIINLVGKPTILRLGGLDTSKIKKTLGSKLNLAINPKKKIAPGQSHLHYSPGIPLRMNIIKPKNNEAFILFKKRKKKLKDYFYLTFSNNLDEAAKNLYSCLRNIKNKFVSFAILTSLFFIFL